MKTRIKRSILSHLGFICTINRNSTACPKFFNKLISSQTVMTSRILMVTFWNLLASWILVNLNIQNISNTLVIPEDQILWREIWQKCSMFLGFFWIVPLFPKEMWNPVIKTRAYWLNMIIFQYSVFFSEALSIAAPQTILINGSDSLWILASI